MYSRSVPIGGPTTMSLVVNFGVPGMVATNSPSGERNSCHRFHQNPKATIAATIAANPHALHRAIVASSLAIAFPPAPSTELHPNRGQHQIDHQPGEHRVRDHRRCE